MNISSLSRTTIMSFLSPTILSVALAAQDKDKYYHVRHIMIYDYHIAQSVIDALDSGYDFNRMAVLSVDPGSNKEGGDLGWMTAASAAKTFSPEFSDAIAGLSPGHYTAKPFKSQFGYHIIKVDEINVVKTLDSQPASPSSQTNSDLALTAGNPKSGGVSSVQDQKMYYAKILDDIVRRDSKSKDWHWKDYADSSIQNLSIQTENDWIDVWGRYNYVDGSWGEVKVYFRGKDIQCVVFGHTPHMCSERSPRKMEVPPSYEEKNALTKEDSSCLQFESVGGWTQRGKECVDFNSRGCVSSEITTVKPSDRYVRNICKRPITFRLACSDSRVITLLPRDSIDSTNCTVLKPASR